jgi:hypothetical protein
VAGFWFVQNSGQLDGEIQDILEFRLRVPFSSASQILYFVSSGALVGVG